MRTSVIQEGGSKSCACAAFLSKNGGITIRRRCDGCNLRRITVSLQHLHPMPSLVRTAEDLKIWKKRRRATNAELATLTGGSLSTIDRKLNGRVGISELFAINLANIDRLIAAGQLTENCPTRLARMILAGQMR